MVRVEVMSYTPTELVEEHDVTIGRCRDLVDKYSVTWVNIVDPDGRTLEELETLFGFHPLALEDALNQDLAPKVEVHDKVFPQLEDIRIRLRKRTPRIMKAGADFLAYTILDIIVDSYFPHLDRF